MNLNRLNKVKTGFNLLAALLITALLSGAAAAAGIGEEAHKKETAAQQNSLNGAYERAFDELVLLTGEMQNTLAKVQAVGTPYQYTLLLSELRRTAGEAETALCSLPAEYAGIEQLSNFFNQAGDYAYVLLKKAATSTPLAHSDMEQLAALHNRAASAAEKLRQIQSEGNVFAELSADFDFYAPAAADEGAAQEANEEYPHLIYDGPFSQSTLMQKPRGLNGEEVTEQQAAQAAKELLGDLIAGEPQFAGRCEGRIPTFAFTAATHDGTAVDIDITAKGGKCLSFRVAGAGGADLPKPDEATGKALGEMGRQYLAAKGFADMTPTYAQYYGSVAVINYAYMQDKVTIYSDLVKLWIDIPSKTVVGLEAANYWMSHVPRVIDAPVLSETEALERVSPALQVQAVGLALIPVTAQEERLCYECKCTYGGDSFIVYINAENGLEEQVYRIIDSEQGQLVV